MGVSAATPARTPRRRVRSWVAPFAAAALLLAVLVPAPPRATAAGTVPFSPKFTTNANGALVTVGNNLLTCDPAASACAAARRGQASGGNLNNNNSLRMVPLDADADPSSTSSSMSRLDLPEGASVLWAGLYWGATLTAGSGGAAAPTAQVDRMRLRVPGAAGYQTVTASTAARDQFGPNTADKYQPYQRFADVTALARAAGSGEYWGADVAAATGYERYAGWAMTVVYTAPGLPLRNLTVFDGFASVGTAAGQTPTVTVPVSGFRAPRSGTVDTQLTMVAYEGDLDTTGDEVRLNSTQLGTALSPGSNFFDSANGLNGASVTTRAPADRNMLGFDIKNLGASGAIPNDATSATFTFRSSADGYYPGVMGLAINLYAPDFTSSTKTVVDLDGNSPSRPGDRLQYTLTYVNTGQDPAVQALSRDPLPANTTYVPGSLALVDPVTGATTPLTDAAGDDVGEYLAADRTVQVRLGSGSDGTNRGTIEVPGSDPRQNRAAYTFAVALDDAAGGTTVTNGAGLEYRTGTTDIAATYATNPASVDVTTRADVAVTKDLTPDPAAAGAPVTAVLTVRNDGPNTAQSVQLRDPVPAGWTTDAVQAPPGAACTTGAVVSCSLGDLPVGQTIEVRLVGHLAPGSAVASLTNVADVTTTSFDPDPSDNVSSDAVGVVRSADLAVTKSASPSSAPPGAAVTYTLAVANEGPSDAVDVLLADSAPAAQLTVTGVTGVTGGATCAAPEGAALRCTVPTLPAGATATVTVTGVLGPSLAGGTAVTNTATATSSTPDPDAADNTATATVTTTARQADVRLTKTAPASVVAGTPLTWTVVATNDGPSAAGLFTVSDVVPEGVTATSVTTSRGTCSIQADQPSPGRQRVFCAVTGLPAGPGPGQPGGTATITVVGTVAPGAPDTLANTAEAQVFSPDPDPGNNTATATTTVTRSYDLAVSKRANRASLPAASPEDPRPVDYTVTVRNAGPSDAVGVTLSDLLPTALEYQSVTAPPGTTCADPVPTADPAYELLACTIASVPAGGSVVVEVHTRAEQDLLTAGQPVVELVQVSGPGDTDPSDDSASWTLSGEPYVDLELTKSGPASVVAGQTFTYGFSVTNHPIPPDSLTAFPPLITDTLPTGVTLVPSGTAGSVTPSWCTEAGGQVVCATPAGAGWDLAPEATGSFELTVRADPDLAAGTALTNAARVTSPDNPDPAPDNNVSAVTSTVTAEADVTATGMAVTPVDPTRTGPGSAWRMTFDVGNLGPSTARGVELRIAVDPDAGVLDRGSLPDACQVVEGELVCTVDDLPAGGTRTVAFTLAVAGYVAPDDDTATATVSSTTPDTDPGNNVTSAAFTVTEARTALTVTKVPLATTTGPDQHAAFVAGRPFAYQVTVQVPPGAGSGLADAQDVVLTDPLPAGFTAAGASTTQGTCALLDGGTVVRCALGTLAAWPSTSVATVTLHGVVDVSVEGEQLPNTVLVTSSTPDLTRQPTQVRATTTVDVVEQADLQQYKLPDSTTTGPDGVPVFAAGGTAGWTLTTVNAGPSDVEQAVVVDRLPEGLTLDPGASPGCVARAPSPAEPAAPAGSGQVVVCAVGTVPVAGSTSVRLVATVPADAAAGPLVNTAVVGSQASDPDPSNDTATATARVEQLADLALSAAVSTTTPAAGQEVTFTGATINNGPSAARTNTIDTVFPPGFVPVRWEGAFEGCTWDRTPPADPSSAPWQDVPYVLHCDRSAAFDPGVSETSVVVMHVPGDTPAGTYTATSRVGTATPESTLANNTTSGALYVQHVSDTQVAKTLVAPDPMTAGRPATWRLTATNTGPSVAHDVVLSDAVPDGMTFVAAALEDGTPCPAPESDEAGRQVVRCRAPEVAVGGTVSALVTLRLPVDAAPGLLCNEALVGSGSLDPEAADNRSAACAVPLAAPLTDVGIELDPPRQTRWSGDRVVLTVTVTNHGGNDATAVVARLDLPLGLSDVTGVPVEWPAGRPRPPDGVVGSLTFAVGDLSPGERVVYRVEGTVTGTPGATLPVSGATTHGELDPVRPNDTDAVVILLVGEPVQPPGPAPGEEPAGPAAGAGAGPAAATQLSATGATVLGLLVAAVGALAVGGGLLAVRRRRPPHPPRSTGAAPPRDVPRRE